MIIAGHVHSITRTHKAGKTSPLTLTIEVAFGHEKDVTGEIVGRLVMIEPATDVMREVLEVDSLTNE